jgi:hypothetical protein
MRAATASTTTETTRLSTTHELG